jgi:hypothetical protein
VNLQYLMIKPFVLLFLLGSLFTSGLFSQNNFIVKDELISDPATSIIDPEYNMQLKAVCWQTNNGELWISGLNPVTRCFSPLNGKGTFVDQDLAYPCPGGWNGPEWVLSSNCTQVVYNQFKGGVRFMGLATKVFGGWSSTTLMQYPDALYAMGSSNYDDTTGMILWESEANDGIHWLRTNELSSPYTYPNVSLGFFARDNQQICCARNHTRQPGYIDATTTLPFFTQVSDDTIGAPFMWNDPETNSRMFMYRTNGSKTVKILQLSNNGSWNLYNSFSSPLPDPYIYITSPEPFTFGGRSYISFMAAQSTLGMDGLPAQIFIAGINPDEPLMRRVSDSTEARRTDPEPVIFSDSAFIYYSEKVHTSPWEFIFRIRKCDTGLENFYTGTVQPKETEKTVSVFPNPSNGKVSISSALLSEPGNKQIEILDDKGKLVRKFISQSDNFNTDLNQLPDGHYLVKVSKHQSFASTDIIIKK